MDKNQQAHDDALAELDLAFGIVFADRNAAQVALHNCAPAAVGAFLRHAIMRLDADGMDCCACKPHYPSGEHEPDCTLIAMLASRATGEGEGR